MANENRRSGEHETNGVVKTTFGYNLLRRDIAAGVFTAEAELENGGRVITTRLGGDALHIAYLGPKNGDRGGTFERFRVAKLRGKDGTVEERFGDSVVGKYLDGKDGEVDFAPYDSFSKIPANIRRNPAEVVKTVRAVGGPSRFVEDVLGWALKSEFVVGLNSKEA